MSQSIVIIGSSIAALSAAEAAVKQDPTATVTLYSDDSHLPYYRQRLAEVVTDPEKQEKLQLHPADWYEKQPFTMHLNTKVTKVNPDKKSITLEDGSEVAYDKLILAIGSKSFVPPIKGHELEGVVTLWTMDNAIAIAERLNDVKNGVVIGGGLLGLEAAYALRQRGIHTTVLEAAPRMLARQLDSHAAELFMDQVESLGIDVVVGANIEEIVGDENGKVVGVRLADGTQIETEVVFISTGVRARLEVLEGTDVEVNRCIVVDDHMRTNVPDIYAAGDCAFFDNRWYGLWTISKMQGETAGANAAGGDVALEMPVPPYVVNTMETHIASAGVIEPEEGSSLRSDIKEDADAHQYARLIYDGNELKGYELLGDTKGFTKLQKELK